MIFLFIYINNYQFILLNACICFSIYTLKFFILKNTLKHFACPIYLKKKNNITMANYGLNGYYMSVFGIMVAVVVVI
jgi:hypothetical protein